LPRRDETLLDAEVELLRAEPEPAAAAPGQGGRLGQLLEPEHRPVEGTGLVLAARRNRELDVVEAEERHPRRSTIAPWPRSSRTPSSRATRGWRRNRRGGGSTSSCARSTCCSRSASGSCCSRSRS